MLPLSATQAISPAFARARLVLIAPFLWGRTWKIAATGYVAAMGSVFFPFPLLIVPILLAFRGVPKVRPLWIDLGWAGTVVLMALFVWAFLLCSHLQFPMFAMVLDREQFVRPEWEHSRKRAWRWARWKLTAGLLMSLVPCAGVAWFVLIVSSGKHSRPHSAMGFFFAMVLGYLLFALSFMLMALVNDLVLPAVALEDLPIRLALRCAWDLACRDPGQVALYAVLRIALGFVGQIMVSVALQVAMYALMLPIGFLSMFAGMAHLPTVLMGTLFGLFALLAFASYVYALPLGMGSVLVFLEAYRLYFLAERYPLLAERLGRSTPPAPVPPPIGMWPAPLPPPEIG